MTDVLSAYVIAESGTDFTCEIANLTTHSLFLRTDQILPCREPVSVVFFSVDVRGEIALGSEHPLGLLVVFTAPPALERRIEAHMAKTPALNRGPITEVIEREVELLHGLTSHAAARPPATLADEVTLRETDLPPKDTVQVRPSRRAQDTKLDNAVQMPRRRRKPERDDQATEPDPSERVL